MLSIATKQNYKVMITIQKLEKVKFLYGFRKIVSIRVILNETKLFKKG